MKNVYLLVCLSLIYSLFTACSGNISTTEPRYSEIEDFKPSQILIRKSEKPEYEFGDAFCYVNQKGDTVIPFGKFKLSFSDTIRTFGIVTELLNDSSSLIGINQKGQRLYEILWFDNGPDFIEEGLFRIKKDGKIGYADTSGKIVIQPQFACAYPFSYGRAQVYLKCNIVQMGEHTMYEGDSSYYIDKTGKRLD